MIEVELSAVEAFLGRVQDPPTANKTAISESAYRAIMFTDMVGSTEMTSEYGDEIAVEMLRAHDAVIRRCLEQFGGSEVKHLGDGIMASFDKVPASVESALKIQNELKLHNSKSTIPIRVRIGIHAGEPVEEKNDLFGSAVQLASRICDFARAGSVLVSHEVKEACSNSPLEFSPETSATLKGFSQPVKLFSPV